MLDRASTFADPEIIKLLQTRFIPVAIDQAYQRRQKDTEGAFYRKIAGQGPRSDFNGTTQGLYIATAEGKFISYSNNRGAERIRRLLTDGLKTSIAKNVRVVKEESTDRRYNPTPPEGGLVVRVRAKVLGGYEKTDDQWQKIFQSAVSRDNLWISKSEHVALAGGEVPKALQQRLAKFHLVDNTRGEPPMWDDKDIRAIDMSLSGDQLTGTVHLETKDGKRGYEAELLGRVEREAGKIVRFDLVALGEFWGEGQYTGGAPKGKFPLAVSFALADDSDVADRIPPQASRGWIEGYIR